MTKAKTKICATCKLEKRISEFISYRKLEPVTVIYEASCKNCYPYKICLNCHDVKHFSEFRCRQNRKQYKSASYESICIVCEQQYNIVRSKKYYNDVWSAKFKEMYYNDEEFRLRCLENSKQWDKQNRGHRNKYRATPQQRQKVNAWRRSKRKTNPEYKIRDFINNNLYRMLKTKMKSSKNNESMLKYLSYSLTKLRNHLENQFEPWMNWNNHGRYDPKTWDGNDPSTWTWQIDHIIPHSDLPYDSMEHPNFKKCWALENLRPYSAKQNLLEGTRRTRHLSAKK